MNLLSELFNRVGAVGESWADIESVHLTIQDQTGMEQTFQCPYIPENMGHVLELYFEHIDSQDGLTQVVVGCIWFKSGNILRFIPNQPLEKILALSGDWELVELPPNPKDADDGPGLTWFYSALIGD
ncbi:hypothetical protein PP187_gp257 [Klebsiella phage vB_KvM-Eowyn]|uniref:Uncharacterized protein n=1 Tax=Klebsiella phage vB_KvM-Eowyn TaxID=2762819 RepID=A0A7R8MJT6_9CAUD|nr:hypothetical protein PP187_gp257 [Klebsiella phage vB_KvM-Eowyn]CAD5236246.1 hypothetical protein LLCLJKAH_00257 [Klebsiella phage vB_KvM-Eowyn]